MSDKQNTSLPPSRERQTWQADFAAAKTRNDQLFTTVSSAEIKPLVSWEDIQTTPPTPPSIEGGVATDGISIEGGERASGSQAGGDSAARKSLEDGGRWNPEEKLGYPGQFPFTRGVHPNMYRGKVWTMRMFSGFATPEDTNQRYKMILAGGGTGLSVAFDLPTLMGRDADDPWSEGEVGRCGVAISSLRDMEVLFGGIPMEKVSTSMTINSPAAIIWAMFIAAAEKQGADRRKLRGTCQNDILKEYIAQKEYIFPPAPSMRLVVDTIEFGAKEMPEWNPVSISGYHIREAGSTAAQELAFTLADGMAYVEASLERGLKIDDFAPRLSFFFNAHIDFFEEIAKYRAARRIWARKMRDKYKAQSPRSWILRFHTQTAGCSLTAQQPENNIVRTAIEALAGVMGGTQSLHTNSMDETLALPSDKAVRIALRTQQILAYETGVVNTIDPFGGSYFMEDLTDKMEAEAEEYFERIDEQGGVIPAIENGYFQRELAKAAYRHQMELESGKRRMVGVNDFIEANEQIDIPILKISPEVAKQQEANLAEVHRKRDAKEVARCLDRLSEVARSQENHMPTLIECAHAYCTLGEMMATLREAFGEYREAAFF